MAAMAETGRMGGLPGLPPPWKLHTPRRRAPDHPPYSEMIQTAIRSLAEAGGSTVATIDGHIRSAHRDLPWGHRNLLPYYLGKLVAAGEVSRTRSGRYSLGNDDDASCCADAAPPPWTHLPSPLRKPSEQDNETPSAPDFATAQPYELGGGDGGLANGDLVEEDAPLTGLLPGLHKCALPQLSIRLLKRKLRERNASFSSRSSGNPVGSPLLRRRGRPPKPKAAIVLEDDQEEEAAAGHEGRKSEAKFVDLSSPAGPSGSPFPHRRGRPPKRNDALVLKDEQHEAGCRDDPKPSSPSPNGGSPACFPLMKRRGRPPKCASGVIIQVQQREAAAGHRDRQCEQMLVGSSSSIEGPLSPPVIKRRGRPPKPKAAMALPDDGHHHHESAAVLGQEGPQPELKLVAFSSMGDLTSSAASPPIKRRGRPPKRKAEACREPEPPKENAMTQSCKEGTEFVLPGHGGAREEAGIGGQDATAAPEGESAAVLGQEGPQPELKLVAFSSMGDPTSSAASPPIKWRGRPPKPKAEACREPEPPKENAMTQSCKEGTEFVLPGHSGAREEAGISGKDATAAPEGEQRVSTRRRLARAAVDGGLRRTTRSMSAGGEAQAQTDRNGPPCGKVGGYDGSISGAVWVLGTPVPWKAANAEAHVNIPS